MKVPNTNCDFCKNLWVHIYPNYIDGDMYEMCK